MDIQEPSEMGVAFQRAEAERAAEKAQRIMREEMEAGLHKPSILDSVTTPHDEAQASVTSGGKHQKLAAIFEQEFGRMNSDADVARMAHLLLEEHCTGIVNTGLKEWAAIQRAMEAAVRFDPRDL